MANLEELKKMRTSVRTYEDTLRYYEEIFRADGSIDDYEQTQLDKLNKGITTINKHIEAKIKELNSDELAENIYNRATEAATDFYYKDDDIVDHSLIDNIPISHLKNGKIDNLNITVHSSYWTEKFLDWLMDNDSNFSVEGIIKEILRINEKDYKDAESLKYAVENYECSGSLISVTKGSGRFQLNGYTNANSGGVIKFAIYIETQGLIQLKSLEGIDVPTGIQTLGGVGGGLATAVMKYSGFGKLTRAVHNYMDNKDPWTDKKGSTWRLTIGGITDLVTLGLGGSAKGLLGLKDIVRLPAVTNILLNIGQEVLENITPSKLDELGLTRESIDIVLSLTETNQYVKAVEIISNLVQAGLISEDLIKKKIESNLTEEDLIAPLK
jgi:hypothetical protein